jgi:hypothetical protein
MSVGKSIDKPLRANLTKPVPQLTVNGMRLDMARFTEAANQLGADVDDVLTIDGYRDAKNRWVPDYNTVRIAKRANEQ